MILVFALGGLAPGAQALPIRLTWSFDAGTSVSVNGGTAQDPGAFSVTAITDTANPDLFGAVADWGSFAHGRADHDDAVPAGGSRIP